MSEQEVPTSVAQRIIIRFLANEGVKSTEILTRLKKQFGDDTLSRTQVFDWATKFRSGRERVENESHSRRPRSSVNDTNSQAVTNLVEANRRLTVDDIAAEIGISVGSVHTILAEQLGLRKLSARWVPRLLTEQHKNARKEICQRLLTRYEEEGEPFLNRIVTVDETWVHHYTPESKRASKEWRKSGERPPIKAKSRLSAGKVLATVFWDAKGVLLVDFLYDRRTVNAAYYCHLLDEVKAAYRQKRRRQPIRDVLLLHDNARPHTAALTRGKLMEIHWTPLEHPPYSPDLSPCDYHMFGPLKEALGGEHFADDAQVKQFVRNWLRERPTSFYAEGIKKLPMRWHKCVAVEGNYVEK